MPALRLLFVTSLALLFVAPGCAGRKRSPEAQEACVRSCEQERCEYRPPGSGDNTAYLECVDGCLKRCGIQTTQEPS